MRPRVIAVGGPTATGKTAMGVLLAQRLGGEVLSCDSMQLYAGMTIGTAAPTREEMQGIPHHMIGVIDPATSFSVADYCAMASPLLDDILSRGRLPIVVGGTGLYMDCLLSGMSFLEQPDTSGLRAELMSREAGELWRQLEALDPEAAAAIHPANKKRVARALEVTIATGETMSRRASRQRGEPPYDTVKICLDMSERETLRRRCDDRVDAMMELGLLDEVRALLMLEGVAKATSMQAIGYKELAAHLAGETTLAEAVEAVKSATRKYAKRQRSWFKRDSAAIWYNSDMLSPQTIFDDLRQREMI